MTVIRTAKSRYVVEKITAGKNGPLTMHVRTQSGKLRKLTRKETGTARFNAAIGDFYRKGR